MSYGVQRKATEKTDTQCLKIAALAGRAARRQKGGFASVGALTPEERLNLAAGTRRRRGGGTVFLV